MIFIQSCGLPDFKSVFFILSLFLEFLLLISESCYGLSSSRTTVVLFGMHNLANSIKNIGKKQTCFIDSNLTKVQICL